jgi:hypothetical protein
MRMSEFKAAGVESRQEGQDRENMSLKEMG